MTSPVFAERLEYNGDKSHEGFDQTELEGCLLAETEEANGVVHSFEAAGSVHTRRSRKEVMNFKYDDI